MGKRADNRAKRFLDVPEANPRPSVAPLHCPNCNAPVPLGTGDTATCAACGASVPLPEQYRALRDADRQNSTDRAEAEHLYKTLGKPPSTLLQLWVTVFVLGAGAIGGVIYVLVAIGGVCILFAAVLLELVLHGLAGPLGIDLIDRFGGGTAYAGFAAAVLVLGVLPAWLASYLQSSGDLRLKLQANLAARPPQQPGFPSTCRQCGAALDVAPGQLGVRCAYCGSDNLVALPAAWVERAGTRQRHFHQSIVEAAAKAAALRSEARGDLKSLGIIGGVLIVIMAGVGHFAMWLDEDDVPITYSASMGPPRVLYNWSDSTTLPENTPGDLHRAMHIALRDGEVFELTTSEPCPKLTVYNTTSFPLFQREDAVPFGIAADGSRVARYIAPYTGLFKLDLVGDGTLRWRIARDRPPLAPLRCD
jgi:uncharacterized Zn finger protein (UPF0148 family)